MTDDIRKGDRFEITVEVVDTPLPGDHLIIAASDGIRGSVRRPILLAGRRLPRPIGVGDRVRWGNGTLGRVEAVHGNHAWVLWDGSTEPITERIRDLTLVEKTDV